jgi:hypothetical protein
MNEIVAFVIFQQIKHKSNVQRLCKYQGEYVHGKISAENAKHSPPNLSNAFEQPAKVQTDVKQLAFDLHLTES